MFQAKPQLSLALALVLGGLAGCASPTGLSPATPHNTLASGDSAAAGATSNSAAPGMGARVPAPEVAPGAIATNVGAPNTADAAASGSSPVAPGQQVQPQDVGLVAGSVDDNLHFADYLKYVQNYQGPAMRPLDVKERHVLQVLDANSQPVANASITVATSDGQVLLSETAYSHGQQLFVPQTLGLGAQALQATGYKVSAAKGAASGSQTFQRAQDGDWVIKLDRAVSKPAPKLDLLFLLDTTGSMGGEIARIQTTMKSMASRIQALPMQPTVRYGLVAYRDLDDTYTTKTFDFTPDVNAFKDQLDTLSAGGGGDIPEDLEDGLTTTLDRMVWDTGDATRLTFLITDAAPHTDYSQTIPYTDSMKKAAAKGIKLFPIGCSGLTSEGEYAMRQLAQFTLGQYLFITRGGDEQSGGGGVSHTVDKFQSGKLDDIVVDIVKAELGSTSP